MELERLSGVPQSVANTAENQAAAQAHNNGAVVQKTFFEKYIAPHKTPIIVGGIVVVGCIVAVLVKQNTNTKELVGLAGIGAEKKPYKKRKRK